MSEVLASVREYAPDVIYLASDGPREWIKGEDLKVLELRNYVESAIDWDCEVKTLFQKKNLGCKKSVHEAVQWFFSQEEKGVVLEDDIVPSLNFFKFCEEMLEFYKYDRSVASIGGRNELGEFDPENGFLFSSKFFCWGWASWADRVIGLDLDVSSNQIIKKQVLKPLNWAERCLVEGMYGLIESKQVNSWAYQYDINFRANNQLQILPERNMIKNVGLSIIGAHSSGASDDFVDVFEGFLPKPNKEAEVLKNQQFIDAYLKKRYGSIFRLYFFSKVKYLKSLKILLKKLR
ncbi:hypothetical protein [Thiomicrorhabdus xiamenensis]|uniref:Uncharacterized protein n=1 Tax=Thiomicrorhabdus xiamenensis TaxID=2739063 RepID=A0A7D4P5L7_9GAMM|nr:hypothetical protein [Thiomicrorhabdus xiamenensis]QKI89775.1 hypothetical protein HQN79_09415 [Thiomicrorhabdus xiamenensis]